jgi:uncharacterized membrane protein
MNTDKPSSRLAAVSTAADADLPAGWRPPDWVAPLFAVGALVLVPGVVLLLVFLPSTHQSEHWDVAWGGFDVALALLLLTVAVTAWRGSPWLEGAATAAATLLFIDAWFDVLTSSSQAELILALVEAVLVELPLALFCLLLARDAQRQLPTVRRRPWSGAREGLPVRRKASRQDRPAA